MQISTKRLSLLIGKQWAENAKLYLLGLLAIAAVMIIAMVFFGADEFGASASTQYMLFTGIYVAASSLFTHTLLGSYGSKVSATQLLTLPASAVERTVVAVFFGMVLFPVVFVLVAWPCVLFAHYVDIEIKGNLNEMMDLFSKTVMAVFAMNVLLQSFILYCAASFRKTVFIKTALAVCLVYMGIYILNEVIAGWVINDSQPAHFPAFLRPVGSTGPNKPFEYESAAPFDYIRVKNGVFTGLKVALTGATASWIQNMLWLMLPFFLLLTVLKLKEKQLR